jgi:indole-3-glycerol phosphate synthase
MREALSRAIRERRADGSLAVIAEVKARAGGVDLLRGRSSADIARTYQAAGATALSVVTSPWFGGSLRMLAEVAAADLGLPILRKDLISTERAVEATRRAGASAVLLVLPLLGRDRLVAMLEAARAHDLEPFVEVATREEVEVLREIYLGVIAINNADIKTNEVDGEGISRSVAVIQRHDPRLWISASRIGGAHDVRELAAAGFDGILMGTRMLLADDLRAETDRIVAAAHASPRCA